jgi:hypothetical protein
VVLAAVLVVVVAAVVLAAVLVVVVAAVVLAAVVVVVVAAVVVEVRVTLPLTEPVDVLAAVVVAAVVVEAAVVAPVVDVALDEPSLELPPQPASARDIDNAQGRISRLPTRLAKASA